MEDPIVKAAQLAFAVRLKDSADVSENTKNAQKIAKAWRAAVHDLNPDRFQIEALVAPELDQKLDVIDQETLLAYEFKVSGKNAWASLYQILQILSVTLFEKVPVLRALEASSFQDDLLADPNQLILFNF